MSSVSSPASVMTPDSDAGSLRGSSPSVEGHDCRAMVRRLLSRYSRNEIDQLLREEGGKPSPSARAPARRNADGRRPSDREATVARHVGPVPNSSSPARQPSAAKGSSSSEEPAAESPTQAKSAVARPGGRAPPYKQDYLCGFCSEIGINKTCTRRNDLRRHIDQFHNTNAQWLCQHRGCHMTFDWQTAYQIHLRNEHGGSQMRMEEAKVLLCPQTVFACGYEGCFHLLEAPTDAEAPSTWKTYTTHLTRHCEEGRATRRWSYSHRMRNLLRQHRFAPAWDATVSKTDQSRLRWDPVASRTLRKLLETRHWGTLSSLINCVVVMGSARDKAAQAEAMLPLHLPIKKVCPAAAIKHEMPSASRAEQQPPQDGSGLDPPPCGLTDDSFAPYPRAAPLPPSHLSNPLAFQPALSMPARYASFDGHGSVSPTTPPQAMFTMPAPELYQPAGQVSQVSQMHRGYLTAAYAVSPMNDAGGVLMADGCDASAVPRRQPSSWTDVYGSGGGLQSPTLTDGCYGVGRSLSPVERDGVGTYMPTHS
ncbi:hypothetical protein DCS_06445 [Drechmeria coniospora]|uniref:C2H2-type domain-containing protein n=1 Tax=Drechmeria coniospora TaxID=98403 RepID=A0A151GBK5_DRECN|nr:hypothetical protein DCS_06445 [Drechmeria coniospora]KYK54487.1 hypothetical protein DCS_06445 [Drechmeria coniospora]